MIEVREGLSPIILGLPHTGTEVPADIAVGLNDNGALLADTDWHVDRLYDGLLAEATTVRTPIHRYVIDVNRDPGGASLYPGQNTTTLCPLTDFDGQTIWRGGAEPGDTEVDRRREAYHQPYHRALADQIERVRDLHGVALLYDCHSIRSRAPFLFEGVLPDFSIGTADGASCDPLVENSVRDVCQAAAGFSTVVNGRFKGGWTTRHYGRPDRNVHAIQMELTQSSYLATEEPPFDYDQGKADRLQKILATVLGRLVESVPQLRGAS